MYDEYWSREDRIGATSLPEGAALALDVVRSCSPGSVLDVGCGSGLLVRHLLGMGVPAQGVDVSTVAVAYGNRLMPGCVSEGSILSLPFTDEQFETVVCLDCLQHLSPEDVPAALKELYRVCSHSVFLTIATRKNQELQWHLTVQDQAWWEDQLFAAGFRRSETLLDITPYPAQGQNNGQFTFVGRKISPENLKRYPLSLLQEERSLHMDMTRESGSRSDAHLVRYQWASRTIQRGDRVLDAACGLGYGTCMLAHLTDASEVQGIDLSESAITYARDMFGSTSNRIRFDVMALPEHLHALPDACVDVIVSFETLEHLEEVDTFLEECARLLTPGGRLITSVPHDWSDETGTDPNPYHHHIFTWQSLKKLLGQNFLVDEAAAQTADRAKVEGRWAPQSRTWIPFDIRCTEPQVPAEWLCSVSIKPISQASSIPFTDRRYGTWKEKPLPAPIDFTGGYENPWISRVLLSAGRQPDSKQILSAMGQEVIEQATSPVDEAAGLIVQLYRILEDAEASADMTQSLIQATQTWLDKAERAFSQEADIKVARQIIRWMISLHFALGRLHLHLGDRTSAVQAFTACSKQNARSFSPMLATKTTQAQVYLGLIAIEDHAPEQAMDHFQNAVGIAKEAMQCDDQEEWDDHGILPPHYWKELSEIAGVARIASHLAFALQQGTLRSQKVAETWSWIRGDSVGESSATPTPAEGISEEWQRAQAHISQGNEWCSLITGIERIEAILHPSHTGEEEQPRLEIPLNRNLQGLRFLCRAHALDPHENNQGVRLVFQGHSPQGLIALQELEVPPLLEVCSELHLPKIPLSHISITIHPNRDATDISYQATRVMLAPA